MQDSDAVDEAGAAHVASRAEQDERVNGLIATAESYKYEEPHTTEQMVGEIMAFGRTLFFWEDVEGDKTFINLDHVTIVNVGADGTLLVKCGDLQAWTEDPALIKRFWAEWEIIL